MFRQVEMISLEELVPPDHPYRYFKQILNETFITRCLSGVPSDLGREGYGIVRLFYGLLLQFMEDLSDRECERFLKENLSGKWLCGFGLSEITPDHNAFYRTRKRIGTERLSQLFAQMREELARHGLISEVFTFVDATHLIAKANLWKERDRAIKAKLDKLNNEVLPKLACDKQAKIGCKGKNKYWYGYKQHSSVDMQSGLINKIAVTPGNVTDAKGLKHVCPSSGAIYADKGYCTKPAQHAAAKRGVHLAAIMMNHMLAKNHDKDRWLSHLRMPYERVFSKRNRNVRYRGIAKNQFAAFMSAISFNLKRILVLNPSGLVFS
ncbi:transposase [Nitrosomonas cryotolerans]|uniref:Transposase and inactivated derivatives, IS5 family n=1 Tax=Nitrosomonas cryotolerans ATCC 49181 TaxID=1131553 RepID=A0A1N6H6K6_9PROT|nr:transposase [Nitrosomonas cryotolerans]SIO15325.1 Transposase and inactivated derivatives, IS5 family [Nitrosomonas cryotolerans ATCC 49181]